VRFIEMEQSRCDILFIVIRKIRGIFSRPPSAVRNAEFNVINISKGKKSRMPHVAVRDYIGDIIAL